MRRPILDLGAQAAPIVSQLIERIFLTGLLVQRLGVGQFERWSLISATVALLTIVDLGTQITFSNRMARAAHRGDVDEAVETFRQSNSIFALLGAIVMAATIIFAASSPLQHWLGLTPALDPGEQIVALALGGAIALKLAMTNVSGVYRAQMAFARGTLVTTGADLLRIGAGIAALLWFGTMAALALAMAAMTILAFAVLIPIDLVREFPVFRWRLARPTKAVTSGAFSESLLFASSFLPSIVLTQIPIMLIGSRAAHGVLASYVLLRTIANVVRTLAQKVTFIVGMELSRLETQTRTAELAIAYQRLTTFAALSFGTACALLWAWGDVLLNLWTGSAALYDSSLLAIMLAPLILSPGTQLNLPLLTYGHRPRAVALAVLLQTVAAGMLALLLPIPSIALRLALALSLAEILVLAPLIAIATRRMIGNGATWAALPNFLLATAASAATTAIAMAVKQSSGNIAGLLLSVAISSAVVGPLLLLIARRLVKSMETARVAEDILKAELPLVSILFIAYNRVHTLVATFESFVRRVTYPRDRMEFILCDDASDPWHRAISDQLRFDRILRSDRNRGLGANQNAGLRAARGDYILSLRTTVCLSAIPIS